jgi:radical SAM protein with 4Fe4S-binding SPASM domain
MTSKFVRLNKNWMLRGWSDIPWSIFNKNTGEYIKLSRDGFYVASSCDGRTDFNSPAFLPAHINLLNKLIEKDIAEESSVIGNLNDEQLYKKAENEYLQGIQWAITGNCNLRCAHCYMEAPTGKPGELSLEELESIIKKMGDANIYEVSVTGGEPFFRRDFIDVMKAFLENNIKIKDIFTNGTLIEDDHLKFFKEMEIDPVFRISFDGWGYHDLMRGTPGVEEKVISTIKKLKNEGFKVSITTSADTENLKCLMNTYEKMKELEVDAWGLARPQPVGCGKEYKKNLSLREMAEISENILKKWLEDGKPFTIGLEAFVSGGKEDNISFSGNKNEFEPESYACSSCRKWPYLSPEGKLMPCISYGDTIWEEKMPSILDESFSQCMRNRDFRFLLDIKKKDVISLNPECEECPFLIQCGTGCRSSALILGGNLFGKDTAVCQLWRDGYKDSFEKLLRG